MMGSFGLILLTPDETDSQRIDQEEEKGETQDERHFPLEPLAYNSNLFRVSDYNLYSRSQCSFLLSETINWQIFVVVASKDETL